jgi:hypothetical protein
MPKDRMTNQAPTHNSEGRPAPFSASSASSTSSAYSAYSAPPRELAVLRTLPGLLFPSWPAVLSWALRPLASDETKWNEMKHFERESLPAPVSCPQFPGHPCRRNQLQPFVTSSFSPEARPPLTTDHWSLPARNATQPSATLSRLPARSRAMRHNPTECSTQHLNSTNSSRAMQQHPTSCSIEHTNWRPFDAAGYDGCNSIQRSAACNT